MESLPGFNCQNDVDPGELRSAMVRSGVVELHNLVPLELVEGWRTLAEQRYDEVSDRMRSRGIDPERDKVRTREVSRRSSSRFDVRLEGERDPGWWSHLKAMPLIDDLLLSLLKPGYHHLFSGIVVACPGARTQHIHRDGGNGLFPEQPLPTPAYALTVFVPLSGFGPEFGPTEFYPGAWLNDPQPDDEPVAAQLELGSALIFDYRLPHRGGAHNANTNRIYAYSVLSRPWFGDHLNYEEPSLFS